MNDTAQHTWLYIKDGLLGTTETVGPISEAEILSFARQGQLKRETLISSPTRTKGAWHSVQQLPGILKQLEVGESERQAERDRKQAERERQEAVKASERQAAQERRRQEDEERREVNERTRALAAQQREQEQIVLQSTFKPRDYPALRGIVRVLYALAILAAFSFLLHFLGTGWAIVSVGPSSEDNATVVIGSIGGLLFMLFGSFILHSIVGIALVATAESIRVMIDIQHNTQATAFYAERGGKPVT